ncbi:MAG: type I-MYXAN CRISPR-associated protein Cmx8 [Planctomycetota bacterium]
MAKKTEEQKTERTSLILEYNLYSLPTAQHKAGLAGLLLMIESMKMRKLQPVPDVLECSATGAKFSLTKGSIQALLNDFFAAHYVEKETLENGKEKERYFYKNVEPLGLFLQALYPANCDSWLRLWRGVVWKILRGKPTTRNVYTECADGQPSSEADRIWNNLVKAQKNKTGRIMTERLVSSLFIGAQDSNAERVSFIGKPENNLLLYFSTIPSLTFAHKLITNKGEIENAGYVLVIPEPIDLNTFTKDIKTFFKGLPSSQTNFLPKDALIYIPEEGGLEYLYRFVHYSLAAVEIYHLEKRGNNIHTLAEEKIVPNLEVLEDYDNLRQTCLNPLYRAQRIRNLLAGTHWHERMNSLFNSYPWEFFIGKEGKTPAKIPFFGNDVKKKFKHIEQELEVNKGRCTVDENVQDDQLARRVYNLIKSYVNHKTEGKSGKRYEDFKNTKDEKGYVKYPEEYRETLGKVCSDAFLAMRGRREKDFTEYFTGTICSVPQFLPEQDYLAVSQALINQWEKVKTLSMLALSACSWSPKTRDKEHNTATEE